MNNVLAVGSINYDTSVLLARMVKEGETIQAKSLSLAIGGKGLNQAVALFKLGADVRFIGKLGNDSKGEEIINSLNEVGLNTGSIIVDEKCSTGSAFILLEENGANRIIIDGGANQTLTINDIVNLDIDFTEYDFVVSQFETPLSTTTKLFEMAKANGVRTILNPAPAVKYISSELLKLTDLIIPNQTEAEELTGISINDEKSLNRCVEEMKKLGCQNIIITLGDKGACANINNKPKLIPALSVGVVDTTAAGDTFVGGLLAKLNKSFDNWEVALQFAIKASSIAIQRSGAMQSIPSLNEMNEL